jgi:hypothetical protein
MRAAYLVDPRVRARSALSEFPSETSGKAPELIDVAPETDWLSSFPEEGSKPQLLAVTPRQPVSPVAPANSLQYAPDLRGSITDYWPVAAAVPILLTLTLIVMSGGATRPQVSAPQVSPTAESEGSVAAAVPNPAAVAPTPAPAVPPVAAPTAKLGNATAAKEHIPASVPPASTFTPPARSAPATKRAGGLPVGNPTAPITSPIQAKALAASAAPPESVKPPTTPPPSPGVTLPIADGGSSQALAMGALVSANVAAAPAKESAPPSSAPSAATPPPAREAATVGVQSVIDRYRAAFNSLNTGGISSFWPTVNERALAKAFEQLQAQRFDFDGCQIDVSGQFARALCSGTANFITKVGSKAPRTEPRRWTFHLSRAANGWIIDRVESR